MALQNNWTRDCRKEEKMKKCFLIMLVVIVGLSLTGVVSAADADKEAIKAKVIHRQRDN